MASALLCITVRGAVPLELFVMLPGGTLTPLWPGRCLFPDVNIINILLNCYRKVSVLCMWMLPAQASFHSLDMCGIRNFCHIIIFQIHVLNNLEVYILGPHVSIFICYTECHFSPEPSRPSTKFHHDAES